MRLKAFGIFLGVAGERLDFGCREFVEVRKERREEKRLNHVNSNKIIIAPNTPQGVGGAGGPPELGDTALSKSFKKKDYHITKLLITHGAVGGPGENGLTCLDIVFSGKTVNFDMAKLALDCGEKIDGSSNKNGLLHKSSQKGYVDQMSFLLENGANPNLKGRQEMTPVHLAARGCKLEAVKLLVEGGGEWKLEAGGKNAKDMAEKQGERGEIVRGGGG